MNTPWGASQEVTHIADGLSFVSTASHGGYHLSTERQAQIAARFPLFRSYTGTLEWLEEDCDCTVAMLAFPDCFSDSALHDAVRMAECMPKMYDGRDGQDPRKDGWLDVIARISPEVRERANRHAAATLDLWERGSLSSGDAPGTWNVSLHRARDNARKWVVFRSYPMQHYYTDAELLTV